VASSSDTEIVIIGGGAAGIAAARRIADARLDCLLVEARSRLGGRAWTINSEFPIDLGCGWLHSADRTPWRDVYDGSRLPYADETFDVLFTIGVMHHVAVDQRNTFVSEARRVLRPGGGFVIFEHNKLNPLVQWIVARCPFDRNAVLLTSWRAQKLVRNAGFREIDCRHILFFPFEAALLRKVEDYLGWLPMGAQYCVTATK
jgi:SAM-dependent methyltransferase